MLETLLAHHCAPAFAGIKPANLAVFQKSCFPNLKDELKRLNSELNGKGIYIEILHECEKRALVMVYRKNVLEKHLQSYNNRAFLAGYGYPENGSLADYLGILKKRLDCENFPHEIGVFLGYPLHDIYCFIAHRGEGCLLVGEWKVYRNAEEAKKLFCRFKACRTALVKHITSGSKTLAQIFCAA